MILQNIDKKVLSINWQATDNAGFMLLAKQNKSPEMNTVDGLVSTDNYCIVFTDGFCVVVNNINIIGSESEIERLATMNNIPLDPISWNMLPKICPESMITLELIFNYYKDEFNMDQVEHVLKIGNKVAFKYTEETRQIPVETILYEMTVEESNSKSLNSNQFAILKQVSGKSNMNYIQTEVNNKIADVYSINPMLFYFRMTDTPSIDKGTGANLLSGFLKRPETDDEGEELCPLAELPAVTSIE
jgi:hypothetical protein